MLYRLRILCAPISPEVSFSINIKNRGPIGLKVVEVMWLGKSRRHSRRRFADRASMACCNGGRRSGRGEENCRAMRSESQGRCSRTRLADLRDKRRRRGRGSC